MGSSSVRIQIRVRVRKHSCKINTGFAGGFHTHIFLGRRVSTSKAFGLELDPAPMISLPSMQWCVVKDIFVLVFGFFKAKARAKATVPVGQKLEQKQKQK